KSHFQSLSANGRRRFAHRSSLPSKNVERDSGNVVATLRHRCGNRRHVFGQRSSYYGNLFYVFRSGWIVRAGGLGQLASGCGFWRASHYFWHHHREEIRWLNSKHSSEKQNEPKLKSSVCEPCMIARPKVCTKSIV